MRHFKNPGSRQIRRIAHALSANHDRGACVDPGECSLHSLGSLWAHGWLEPPADDRYPLIDSLTTLVAEHPLRGWTLHLVHKSADWIEKGWMTPDEAEGLITTAVDTGLHEHLANSSSLAASWASLIRAAAPEVRPRLARTGNKIVAAGGTYLIEPQLELLRDGS
jgi:hypothetical protein